MESALEIKKKLFAATFVIEVKVPGILFIFILFISAEDGICGVYVFWCVTCEFCRRRVKRGVDEEKVEALTRPFSVPTA